jgi:nucleotide-binding universal stress UspA family protein
MVETGFPPPMPIRSLLVPLDGSRLAEAAVPAAVALANAFTAMVTLLHVLESDPPAEVHGEPHLARTEDATAYLDGIAKRFASAGVNVAVHVHADPERDVSGSIVRHADETDADLIVLANHGSGGLRGFLFGRVAQQVLQRGRRPVLAIPVAERQPSPAFEAPRRLAVLLNRTDEAEAAIPLSVTLAKAFDARIHLILAVPTRGTLDADRSATATLLPSAAREVLELEEAVRVEANLLAMTTHARGGLSGLLSGSVGAKILARSNLPLLLVPAPSDKHSSR